jgi:hypothetical protein
MRFDVCQFAQVPLAEGLLFFLGPHIVVSDERAEVAQEVNICYIVGVYFIP